MTLKKFNSRRTGLRHQRGRRCIVLVHQNATGRQKEEDGKTLVCDKRDRPVTFVFSGDLHLSKCCLKEGEVRRESFSAKLLSRLSHKVCRLLSSPVLLRKLRIIWPPWRHVKGSNGKGLGHAHPASILYRIQPSLVNKKTSKI